MKNHLVLALLLLSTITIAQETYKVPLGKNVEPVMAGKFQPNWESLSQYVAPTWFRNAKFGIWAHWGPQCQPEGGDWYARQMYVQSNGKYRYHVDKYGHPSEFGFKDVINEWKAEKWNPEQLVAFYKKVGARYFFAMANHHDNLDMWDSKYQPWNSVNMGPKRDIVAEWAKAAKNNGLPLGLSVHASHAWTWYEFSQQSDTKGALAGVPYDGKLTKADGKGKWWEGYDPQDLYAQNHPLSERGGNEGSIHGQWAWGGGASIPSAAYCDKFYNRTMDLINRYKPDLLYFDDTALPLYPISPAGLNIAAHYYNESMNRHAGQNDAVLFGKVLTEDQKKSIVWDVERGAPDKIQEKPWQTCTCIGDWHYEHWRFYNKSYKSPAQVVHMLVDVVSKNGCLLLNVPVKGDGSIDSEEIRIMSEIGKWMDVNKESIYETRPWKVYGEGPVADKANPINAQGFNEGGPMSSSDIRFNQLGKVLYITVMGIPTGAVNVKSCGKTAGLLKKINKVEMLGSAEKVIWTQNDDALALSVPTVMPCQYAVVYKVTTK